MVAAVSVPILLLGLVASIDRANTWRDAEDRANRIADVLQEHATKVLETLDLVLRRVDDRLQGLDPERIAGSESLHRFLRGIEDDLDQVDGIWITDADGRALATGRVLPVPDLVVADRDYFQAQRERDAGLYISEPCEGRITRSWTIAASRRRGSPDGDFIGTVHITVSTEYFARYWQDVAGASAYSIDLIRHDGTVLAGYPGHVGVRRLLPDGAFRQAITNADAGSYTRLSTADGVERITAYKKVGRYPVYIRARIDSAVALQGWRARCGYYGLAAAAAIAVLLGLALTTARQRARVLRSELGAWESEARYRLLAEHASDVIMRIVVGGERVYVSPSVTSLLGYEPGELVGGSGFSLVHPDDAKSVEAVIRTLVPDGPPATVIHRTRRKDGSYLWAELLARLVIGADGRPEIVGAIRDITARRAAEERLRESEALNRSIVESSTDCIKVLDLDGNLLFMNGPGLCAREIEDFGVVRGRPWTSLWPEEARAAVAAALAAARAGRPGRFAAFCPTVKGKPRWWDVAVNPVRDHDDRPVRLLAISRDVTAQHQAEQHLRDTMQRAEAAEQRARRAQIRLEEAIAALPEGFALYDSLDRLVVCNARTRELYPDIADVLRPGETYETMLRAFAARSVRLPSAEAADAWIAERLAYHRDPAGTIEVQLADGRWVRIEERKTKSGDTVGMRVDITALKERESTFKLLFESNPVPMWVCDRETLQIIEANGSALAQYGYDQESFLSLTLKDLRPAEDVTSLQASMAESEPPNGRFGVWRHRRADGTVFEVDIVSRRFQFRGRPAALVAAIDVTAQRRAEEALRDAKEEAEAASRTKSQFLANMSHELRTPLNAVIGFSEIIMDAVMGPVDGRYREYARDIHKSGQHLLGLIGDVLDLSKVEAGRLELHEGAVDVGRVIAACRRLVIERARANGVAIEEAVAPDLPPLMADELRLKQIVLNLVSNAVKFTPAGGRVSVAASVAEGGMTITVADTGIGMRTEDIPAALEPFRQVDDALNRRFQGTGLGLPLAKMLTELHGGTLEIASEPGRGTAVRVRLPESRVVRKAA